MVPAGLIKPCNIGPLAEMARKGRTHSPPLPVLTGMEDFELLIISGGPFGIGAVTVDRKSKDMSGHSRKFQ